MKQWQEPIDNELIKKEKSIIAKHLYLGLKSRFSLKEMKEKRIVDIGGGDGQISHKLAPLFSEIVVVEKNPVMMDRICEINFDVPNMKVVGKDFFDYVPQEKFPMPRNMRDIFLRKAIEVTKPDGLIIVVVNSTTSKPGNHVHFRDFIGARWNIIQGTQYTIEERLKLWGYPFEKEEVRISHQKQSPEAMAELISLVLPPERRWKSHQIVHYVENELKKPYGYEFYSDQEILWVKI
jgi:SAM-dependent methyltransferase